MKRCAEIPVETLHADDAATELEPKIEQDCSVLTLFVFIAKCIHLSYFLVQV